MTSHRSPVPKIVQGPDFRERFAWTIPAGGTAGRHLLHSLRRYLQVVLSVGLLWCATEAGAQPTGRWKALTSVVFRNYGHDQGMPHPVATALAQDHDGFIWIGTQGGLARWDGYRFKSYKADASVPGSLPDDWIQTLHVDPAGRLWIGTTAGQLALYDSARD